MALARAWSVALTGVRGQVVEVEADLAPGDHVFVVDELLILASAASS